MKLSIMVLFDLLSKILVALLIVIIAIDLLLAIILFIVITIDKCLQGKRDTKDNEICLITNKPCRYDKYCDTCSICKDYESRE